MRVSSAARPAPHQAHPSTNRAGSGGVYDSVVDAIGNTPLVRLNALASNVAPTILLKLEYLNPGGSVKDRAAREMVLAAERSGDLAPNGVIVEGTSGNTGIGLAIIAAARGYSIIVVVPDKTSTEKIGLLRGLGARVVVTPGGRPIGHPEHVRSVAEHIASTTPGAWLAGQYDNPANPAAHSLTTGPEIWRQTDGAVTHFVAGVGTGGTITGTGEFLKSVSDGAVRVIAPDPLGSTYSGGEGRAFYIESVGHYRHPDTVDDVWPESFHPDVVDEYVPITDREAIDTARELLRHEGLLVGGSGALAVAGALRVATSLRPDDVLVVLIPDSGRNYLSKYFDDTWVSRWGFGAADSSRQSAVRRLRRAYRGLPSDATVPQARTLLADAPSLPVHLPRAGDQVVAAEIIGSVDASTLVDADDDAHLREYLGPPTHLAGIDEPIVDVAARLGAGDFGSDGHSVVVLVENGYAVGVAAAADILAATPDLTIAERVTETI